MDEQQVEFENIKISNQHGSDALRSIFLLNGGASIALLAFLGSLAVGAGSSEIKLASVAEVLLCFSLGAGFCVVAHSLNYLNLLMHRLGFSKTGIGLLFGTILAALVSLSLFFVGIWKATSLFGA